MYLVTVSAVISTFLCV